MGGPRSVVPKSEIIAAFLTDVPFKAYAAKIGMSPNTLRGIWKDVYGDEAILARGKRLQVASATIQAKAMAANRVFKDVTVQCNRCHSDVVLKSNQVGQMDDPRAFVCDACQGDRDCPVCNLRVDGERGLSGHFRHRREAGDADHIAYQDGVETKRWEARTLDVDFVVCRECGQRMETLANHFHLHGLTADQYKSKYSGALVRSEATTGKMSESAKLRQGGHGKGDIKTVTCPGCGSKQDKSKFLVQGVHDFRCPACRQKAEDARWAEKIEGTDYVCCLECGYRAENLTSHIQNAHSTGYSERHPDALIVALSSAVRDKTAIRGVIRPPEFGQKIREAKLLGFTLEDFKPFLEPDGTVDHREMLKAVGCSLPTLQRYMDDLGLTLTKKYIQAAGEERRVTLTAEQLEIFKLKNGKVSPAAVMRGLNLSFPTVKRECVRLGMPSFNRRIKQTLCLDAIAGVLGGMVYEDEWKTMRFTNPLSGHRFRFDGYFSDIGLVVEFHGHQHYIFPNAYMLDDNYLPQYEALRERDRIKREMITNAPDLTYLEILEDEPYMDPDYLAGRLVQAGILTVGPGGLYLKDRLVRPTDHVNEGSVSHSIATP